ncbi:enoyl-CoA hydratase-related protein [Microvirga ossetica]|uniref:enoyl-CoA hydratase-related protein n=1 Tax=Microvirga ossetica TaxID=1882682 RepID=UPI001F00649B|nr:enoyl-CoA hydratase-related protein [Microvirga ossetica]
MAVAQNEAIRLGLEIEEADAVISKPFGIPSTGIFGLLDLVGINLMVTILQTLQGSLPESDALQACEAAPSLVKWKIAENRTGRKAGGAFVRLSADRRQRDVIDLLTGEYRPQRPVASASLETSKGNPRALMEHDGLGGRYAAAVMEKALAYAASLIPEIANAPDAVDLAMRTGYGWKYGPFELMDHLGADWLSKRLHARGIADPAYLSKAAETAGFYTVRDGRQMVLHPDGSYQPIAEGDGVLTLAALSRATGPTMDGAASKLWDLGDGVAGFEFRSKMNTISPALLDELNATLEKTKESFRALVIGSDASVFSAGADLRIFLETVESGRSAIGDLIDHGHGTFRAVKYAPFPVVGAAAGLALGGGCELLLHCDAIQAHAELSIGLVETRIGVIPGWGGCKEMLLRFADASGSQSPTSPALAAFILIAPAKVSASAFEARRLGFLRESDGITMNLDRLIADAKHKALELAASYQHPAPQSILRSGASGASAIRDILEGGESLTGQLSPHDRVVGETLIKVLTGRRDAQSARHAGEDVIMALEREAFIDRLSTSATMDRVRHMLKTGKPLRN